MKISYNWLKEHLDFNLDPISTADLLTDIGLEVERTQPFENITGIKLNKDVDADFGVIDSMLKLNNYEQEAALARKVGYQRGSEKINSDIVSALGKTFGKGVIPAQQFLEGRVQ